MLLLKLFCKFGWHNYVHAPMPHAGLRYVCQHCGRLMYHFYNAATGFYDIEYVDQNTSDPYTCKFERNTPKDHGNGW